MAIGLALIALPIIWAWTTRDRSDDPPPPPPPAAKAVKKIAPTHAAVPGQKFVIETSKGKITAILYEKDAKITTSNFIGLVKSKFYDGLIFHRVERGFVIQTGDPTGTGSGGSKKTIPLEVSPVLKHDSEGIIGMARSNDPNSASSQFYITLRPTPELDGNYAVFGKVVSGMDVVGKIAIGDKVKKIRLLP
jgi:peptidyl-prolyl cis-trans isomerase B (cyclophilin B)